MQHGGSYSVRADVRTEVTAACLMEIFYEMDRMGTTIVGEDELLHSKRYMGGPTSSRIRCCRRSRVLWPPTG